MEKEKLTNKDVDRQILMNLDDYSLLQACSVNDYFKNKVCDDDFIRRRLEQTYPETLRYKFPNQTWRQFFLETIKYIADLSFRGEGITAIPYNIGNLRQLYSELERIRMGSYRLLGYIKDAVENNQFAKAEYLEKYEKIFNRSNTSPHTALSHSVRKGNFNMVKYLMDKVPYNQKDIIMVYMHAKNPDIVAFLHPRVPENARKFQGIH
jgi:hypothetical protein